MLFVSSFTALLALVGGSAAIAAPEKRAAVQIFSKPAFSPFSQSSNYVGQNNGTLPKTNVTVGKVFDRFIQIWLENTDYAVAASTPALQALAKEGLVLTSYEAITHVSPPNLSDVYFV